MHPTIHDTLCVIRSGLNMGTTSRSDQDAFDLLEARFGVADDMAIKTYQEAFDRPYDPTVSTFAAFISQLTTARGALERSGELPTRITQYETLKKSVGHIQLFKLALDVFEMSNPTSAQRTFAALATHLTTFANSNAEHLKMATVINQVAQTKPKAAAATDEYAAAIHQALGSRTPTAAQKAALLRDLARLVNKVMAPELPAGSCKNHPTSTTHTTEMCIMPSKKGKK